MYLLYPKGAQPFEVSRTIAVDLAAMYARAHGVELWGVWFALWSGYMLDIDHDCWLSYEGRL